MSHVGSGFAIAEADHIAAVAKGLAVLESFDTSRQRINATIAAQRTGMTRAAARRHLLTLASLGYLECDGSHFWLTPKVMRFCGSYLASARLPKLMQPTLNRLAMLVGESVCAAVLDGDEVVVIARSGPTRLLAHGLHLGARLPAHATSTGRILLASMPTRTMESWLEQYELRRLTMYTVVEKKAFRDTLERARTDDFCVASQQHEVGVVALAVPVRDLRGGTVAAMNIVLPASPTPTEERVRELVAFLQEGARELSALL